MSRYFWHKIVGFALTVLLVSAVTFVILQVLPGDPALLVLGTEGSPEAYEELRSELQLDQPALLRYFRWLQMFFTGNWGNSLRYSLPVAQLVDQALLFSGTLALFAIVLALLLAIPMGIFMATNNNSLVAQVFSVVSQIGMAVPQFWLGLLLIQLFAVRLGLLPAGGVGGFVSLILPLLTLAIPRSAVLTRFVYSGFNEVLAEDYIRTAKAKGLPREKVLYKHALRNSSLTILTIAGFQFAQLLAGTIVVEQVFGLPGMGQLLLSGVMQRDLPLVQALVMVIVIGILLVNLLVDLILGFLDPRLRFE